MEMDGSEVSCVDEENEKKMEWFGGVGRYLYYGKGGQCWEGSIC